MVRVVRAAAAIQAAEPHWREIRLRGNLTAACGSRGNEEVPMILIRDVFRLKFGKARDALAAWKEMAEQGRRSGAMPAPPRLLTDLVGPYYTLVMETTAKTFRRGKPT